jgi:hypothetical protein
MQLPILETAKYTVIIPSTNKTVEFRPYLVKEEKILMLAMESEDEKQIISAVKEIVRACTFDKLNPDDLSTVDLEYVFLKLRAKSVGENAHVQLKCQTKDCAGLVDTDINLDSIQPVSTNPNVSNKIQITDKVGMTLRPITVRAMSRLSIGGDKPKGEQVTALVIASIESIYDEKAVYRAEDHSIEDLTAFVDSLSTLHLQKIQQYLEGLPRLSKEVEYFCPKCKCKQKLTLTGIQSFFA